MISEHNNDKGIRQEKMLQVRVTLFGGHEYLYHRLKALKINEMDQNDDQQISVDEFRGKFAEEVPEQVLDTVFQTIDVNRDGTITPLEFHHWQNKMTLRKMEDMMTEQNVQEKPQGQTVRLSVIQTRTRMPSELAELRKEEQRSSVTGNAVGLNEDEKIAEEKAMEEEQENKEMTLQELEKRKVQISRRKDRIPVGNSLFANKCTVVEVRDHSPEVHDMHSRELEDALLGRVRVPQRMLLDTESYLLKYGFFDKTSGYTMIPVSKYPVISLDMEIPVSVFDEKKKEYMSNFQQLLEVDPNDVILLASDKHETMEGFCTIHFILCRTASEWTFEGRRPQNEQEEITVCTKIQSWVSEKLASWRRTFKDEVWLVKTLRDLDFQKLDADNNHRIDFEEFKNYIAEGCVEPLLDCVYRRLFNDLDDNGDGQISPREFLVWKQSYTVKKLLQMFPITYIHAYLQYTSAPSDIDLKVTAVRDYFYKCMQYVPFDFEIDCITYCYNDRVMKPFARLDNFTENTKIMFDYPFPRDVSSIAYNCYTNRNREFGTYSSGGEYGQGHYLSTNCEYVMNEMIGTERWTDANTEEEKESWQRRYVACVCAVNVGTVQVLEKAARGEAIPRKTDCFCVENIDGKWGSDTFGSIAKVSLSVGASADTDEVDAHSMLVDQYVVKDARRILPMFIIHMKRQQQHFLWSDNVSNVEDCMRSMITKRLKLSKQVPDKVYCCLTFRDLSRTIELKQIKSKQIEIVAMAFLRNDEKASSFAKGVKEAFENTEKAKYKLPVELLNIEAKTADGNKLDWALTSNGSIIVSGKGKKVFKQLKKIIKTPQRKVVIVTVRVNP
ncbi:hypothetical protein RFI_16998 [Reticulomyxa filosa]|uniref:EF-hand domain-containing protein n=1 Tax=Reticulomyxa filosa TaxID=46433 RepID=X6N2T8_RETFI|nr:hypothetical protein RFI_16998 [Reticulomyxa filosa]|eukprot:ETO20218.1 hypothetical protein RFI_16998 [Reticulomyxa filosa]